MAVVLITGCSSGFGEEFARAFARRGDRVVATMRRPAAEHGLHGVEGIELAELDVTVAESIQAAVSGVLERHGRIDVLVNNAGIGVVGALEVLEDALLREVFDTNVFGAVAVTRAVLPTMRRQQSGRVIFTSAIGALLNTAYLGAYCASKHALDCVAATFDIETRPFGVHVSSVLPSAFNTGMGENMRLSLGAGTPYAESGQRYFEGLLARMQGGSRDLSPVVSAVLEAATSAEPRARYLVAPHLADVLGPLVEQLEALHQREVALTPGGGGNAPR